MGMHEDYGKQVLREAAGDAYCDWGAGVEVDYGTGRPARIDGTVASLIAVEIESRVPKQVRGAVLDLICHPHTKKLLTLMPVYMTDVDTTADQCRFILGQFIDPAHFRVVVLRGAGEESRLNDDVSAVKTALSELGFSV